MDILKQYLSYPMILASCVWVIGELLNSSMQTNHLYEYPEEVDFRIIVLTFNRPDSLVTCLRHVNDVITDGAKWRVEVWVDRYDNGSVDGQTIKSLSSFQWKSGLQYRIHVHTSHVGLYGQWLRTWRPSLGSKEVALFLEDDVDVSPYAYRWLRAAYERYRTLPDLAGISLQEEYIITSAGRRKGVALRTPRQDPIYMYRIVGPWGFSPHPDIWRDFLDWFDSVGSAYRPRVPEAELYDSWYGDMERENRTGSMWIMWFIHFCHKRRLYTAYANLGAHVASHDGRWLTVNRREDGLHFRGRRKNDTDNSLTHEWYDSFVLFPNSILRLDYDGTYSPL